MWLVLASGVLAALKKWLPALLMAFGVFHIADSVSAQVFEGIMNRINSEAGSLSAEALNALHFSGILEGITVVITAYVAAISIKAAKSALAAGGS